MKGGASPLSDGMARAILERVGMRSAPAPDLRGLNELIAAWQTSVPFENIDIYFRLAPILLDVDSLFDKIASRRRGGYCFELNGLFVPLLLALGFDARPCLARTVMGRDFVTQISHRANIVTLGGEEYFCDVGFGGPAPLDAVPLGGAPLGGEPGAFRTELEPDGWWTLFREPGPGDEDDAEAGSKKTGERIELRFLAARADPADFTSLNFFQSEHPDSYFRKGLIVNLRTARGSISITGNTLTERDGGAVSRRELAPGELPGVLREKFGIEGVRLGAGEETSN